MAVPVEQFVKQLEDSGILAGDTLKDFLPPKGTPKDAEELARELVKQKKLTKFQAEQVYAGKGKSLTLGNYLLIEKIGAGGMGQVFKARHRRMDRLVAVKLLPPAMTKDKAAIARFEREVKAAAKLRHPNIVAADDADQANGVHFLVMELVEGSDLSALVKKNGPFGVDQAVNYITQAARGLEAAHAEGIVHRDIKPANLLLDKKGTVKILDMGLARIEGGVDAPTQAELTSTGTVMGTVDYMAPEQALSTKTADARADIYSLGCSLFYLLCGKATYDGDTLMAKLLAHQGQPIPSLRATRPEVSELLDSVFAKMVAKKVENRYQTMTEVITDLERCRNFNEQTVTIQQPLSQETSSSSTTNPSLSNFLEELSQSTTEAIVAKPTPKPKASPSNKRLKLIAAGVLGGLILLFGIIIKLKTKEGKLIVEVNEPGAVVQVLDEEGKVQITRKNEQGAITISVVPGKHQLKVEKDGFKVITKDFEIETNGKKTITAKLIPLKKATSVAGKTPPENPPTVAPQHSVPAASSGKLFMHDPAFSVWTKKVQAMPAEKQLDAVSKKLMELNPGFDGNVTPIIEKDVVTQVRYFASSKLTDISPLRALNRLTSIKFDHCFDLADISPLKDLRSLTTVVIFQTQVSDLSPLKGNRLTSLNCSYGKVSDLSHLRGMPLSDLNCYKTPVSDLNPLVGMPLTILNCESTQVSDLSPLKGMKLTLLACNDTQVSDLSPLKGMPLTTLICHLTQVSDLSPLKGMPLFSLACSGTKVTDFSPLKDMPLKLLQCDFKPERDTEILRSIKTLETINSKPAAKFWKEVEERPKLDKQVEAVSKKLMELNPGFDGKVTPTFEDGVVTGMQFLTDNVTDISPVKALVGLKSLNCACPSRKGRFSDLTPLKGMQLTQLNCDFTLVSDLLPLKGMPLTELSCDQTQVSDLTPLKDMKLTVFIFSRTQVSDLSPLKGMPLTTLWCVLTQVSDLSLLKGMPLFSLACDGTKVTDFSPLKDTPLEHLQCDFKPERDTEILRSIKTLKFINSKPVAEFWKQVDGK